MAYSALQNIPSSDSASNSLSEWKVLQLFKVCFLFLLMFFYPLESYIQVLVSSRVKSLGEEADMQPESCRQQPKKSNHCLQNKLKTPAHLALLEVLYNILYCSIAFRVCYTGKTGMIYSICCISCAIQYIPCYQMLFILLCNMLQHDVI